MLEREYKVLKDFLEAALKKLPKEATFLRDAKRRMKRKADGVISPATPLPR